jgi:hypothetical protein
LYSTVHLYIIQCVHRYNVDWELCKDQFLPNMVDIDPVVSQENVKSYKSYWRAPDFNWWQKLTPTFSQVGLQNYIFIHKKTKLLTDSNNKNRKSSSPCIVLNLHYISDNLWVLSKTHRSQKNINMLHPKVSYLSFKRLIVGVYRHFQQ